MRKYIISGLLILVLLSVSVYSADLKIFFIEFQDSNLDAGCLTVVHGLGINYQLVMVYDNDNKIIEPDEIEWYNVNTVKIYLTSYGTITGIWHVVLLGGD